MRRGSAVVWLQTLLVIAGYAAAIVAADRLVASRFAFSRPLGLALAFAGVQGLSIAILILALVLRKILAARRAARSARLREEITSALATEAAGQDRFRKLRSLLAASPRDVEREMFAATAMVRGSARDRLLSVARQLGIPVDDEAQRIERLFATAMSGSLLEQIAVTEQLEPYALRIAASHVSRALTSSDPLRIMRALDMLRAWRRVVQVPNFAPLLEHPGPEIRANAFRALPYVPVPSAADAIAAALRDPEPRVREAAANAAAKMNVTTVMALLLENVSGTDAEVARAAAMAVASMPGGPAALQSLVTAGERRPASLAAFEALEKATLGRLEIA